MSGEDSRLLGRWGEALAAEFCGGKAIGSWLPAGGAGSGDGPGGGAGESFLCFVEVKLRGASASAPGRSRWTAASRERLRTTAELYLQQHPSPLQPRFDVVEILAPQGMATKGPGSDRSRTPFSGAE